MYYDVKQLLLAKQPYLHDIRVFHAPKISNIITISGVILHLVEFWEPISVLIDDILCIIVVIFLKSTKSWTLFFKPTRGTIIAEFLITKFSLEVAIRSI